MPSINSTLKHPVATDENSKILAGKRTTPKHMGMKF